MGQVRAGLRVLAQRDPDPVRVLAGLDAFVADLGVESFVTALVAVLDPAATTLTVASAGHPPPLLRRPDGQICVAEYLAVPAGPPLGVPADRRAITEQLESGDMLVLYTDGLVEAPGADLLDGMAQLRQLTAGAREVSDPRVLCGLLVDHLAAGQDDVAVLAVVVDDSTHLAATLDLPAHADAAAQARSWIAATLVGWDLPAEMVEDAQLCTTELVTNVLLHARSAARVDVNLDDHRLLVAVADAGTSGEVRLLPADPTAERGRGLLLLDAIAADWGHERTSRGTTVWFQLPRPQPATIST
jgi:anti-sigma regulatory factor (Ser/Thr protein kinase)